MRQNQVEPVFGEGAEPRSPSSSPPPPPPPRGRAGPRDKRKTFSSGFHDRLDKIAKAGTSTKYAWHGLSQTCELDHSQLSKEEALEFAKIMFEMYYTDKTVRKLIFEKNCAKLVAGYCLK